MGVGPGKMGRVEGMRGREGGEERGVEVQGRWGAEGGGLGNGGRAWWL